MLRRLRELMAPSRPGAEPEDPQARIRRSVAALLIEIARVDHDEQAEELAVHHLLARFFHLDETATAELVQEARSAVDGAVSLREFTAPLHQLLSYADKQQVIGLLWQVAMEDAELHRYEDYLIGKLADLLYVSRGDVVRLRHAASEARRQR